MTNILGICYGHPDSAACLISDGELIGAVAEERLGKRVKHDSAFPKEAVKWVLTHAGLTLEDIDYVAVARDPFSSFEAIINSLRKRPVMTIKKALKSLYSRASTTMLRELLAAAAGNPGQKYNFRIIPVEHHLAHIASSYLTSGFDNAYAFSFDGSGDSVSVMTAECRGTNIKITSRQFLPASLGHFYTAICQLIGFDKYGEEFKVMGLAPYGRPKYVDELRRVLTVDGRGRLRLNPLYIDVDKAIASWDGQNSHKALPKLYTPKLEELLGPARQTSAEIAQREKDIARSAQAVFEETSQQLLRFSFPQGGNLVMAGGCALNGVNNAAILRNFDVAESFIHPASSDDGTALGAAAYCWNCVLGNSKRINFRSAYLGPGYSEEEIKREVSFYVRENAAIRVEELSEEVAIEKAAQDITDNLVVGWFQGRSEWGPRALGARSILANPAFPGMKSLINSKIKKRESFRPFAPSVLKEDQHKYFEQDVDSPFMMHVVKFRKEWANAFPSVTHVDGTGRIQTVTASTNQKYYSLIKAVKKHTGHGMVLNTSFNENEPVVDTPRQAIDCFLRTDMDVLYLGNTRLVKK